VPVGRDEASICSRCSSLERPASGLETVTEYGFGSRRAAWRRRPRRTRSASS
jgi:hypothetical protein